MAKVSLFFIPHSIYGINWRGLRSCKTSASGRVSGLRWYISPNMEAVRRYRRTEYHSGECCCSLVVIFLALCSDTCRLDCRLGKSGNVMGVELSLVHTRLEGLNSSETPSPLPHTLSKNVLSSALAVPQYSGGLGSNSSKLESPLFFSFPYTCFSNLASDIFKPLSFLLRGGFH